MEGFDIEVYMQKIKQELLNTFGDELVYLGLQGSFRRGEARESSDIDVMVILEEFTVERMAEYREILKRVGNFNKSCGFICGRKEMKNWNRFEICQLLHETIYIMSFAIAIFMHQTPCKRYFHFYIKGHFICCKTVIG